MSENTDAACVAELRARQERYERALDDQDPRVAASATSAMSSHILAARYSALRV